MLTRRDWFLHLWAIAIGAGARALPAQALETKRLPLCFYIYSARVRVVSRTTDLLPDDQVVLCNSSRRGFSIGLPIKHAGSVTITKISSDSNAITLAIAPAAKLVNQGDSVELEWIGEAQMHGIGGRAAPNVGKKSRR